MTTKSCLSGPFLLFLCGAVSGLGSVVVKEYLYFHEHYNWHEAQSICRSSTDYTDLATIFMTSDEDQIIVDYYYAWVGLHNPPNSWWKWTNGASSNYRHWANGEPDYGEDCAYVTYSSRKFYSTDCGRRTFFFCQKSDGGGDKFRFVPQSKTWAKAQEYCKSQFIDLASLSGNNDVNSVDEEDFPLWTGLHREGGTWKWSSGLSEYRNWASQEPSDRGDCVSISSLDKMMSTRNCADRFPIVCFSHNLVLVKEDKTWEEALEHCRALGSSAQYGLRYDLVSVQPGKDHEYVTTKVKEADTEEVWAGLRFLAGDWLWVNRAAMLFHDLPRCPTVRQRCGALTKNNTDSLLPLDCSEKRNFLCYSTY